jgi:Protein of unknown function (DUF5132)
MAFLEDMFKGGNIVVGLAIGVGAVVLAPVVIPALRPIAKSVIKVGLIAYDQGRVALADVNEHTGDIMAEARAELADAASSRAQGPQPSGPVEATPPVQKGASEAPPAPAGAQLSRPPRASRLERP